MVHRPQAIDFVSSLGAEVVLPLTKGWVQAVQEHTDGRNFDDPPVPAPEGITDADPARAEAWLERLRAGR